MKQTLCLVLTMAASCTLLASCGSPTAQVVSASPEEWQAEFNIPQRALTHTGESEYFVLNPGFQRVMETRNEKLTITVLDETVEINGIATRVVEEREEKSGVLAEVARNYFAMDRETGDVFFFGADVEVYRGGRIVSRDGTWLAHTNESRPGLIMPGAPEVGMKYHQEIVPGIAEDRAEVISTSGRVTTPAGVFENCLVIRVSSELEPGASEEKVYAPGIGLVQEGSLRLVSYGYIR